MKFSIEISLKNYINSNDRDTSSQSVNYINEAKKI